MEKARELARFASKLTFEALPENVVDKAKELILDQLGCQIAGSTMPWGKTIFEYIKENGGRKKESTVVNYGTKASILDAAFANANFGHAFLGDDTDSVCHAHLGSIIIPAAIAVGEREKINGKELIKAVVAGYEISSRIGAAATMIERRGFHIGPVVGPFGVSTSAGIILKFDEQHLLDVMAVAGSQCSGLMEYSKTGGTVNRLHSGIAAYGGIRSALLVQKGFTGPATVLEGEKGFFNAFSVQYDDSQITSGLGKEYRVLLIGLKSNCACGTLESGLDAVAGITADCDMSPDDIEEITVRCDQLTYKMTAQITQPKDITSAQFAGRFSLAMRILKGANTFREYTESNLQDRKILSLESKTKYVLDEELEKIPDSENPMQVTIKMTDGTIHERTTLAGKGSILNPMTKKEVEQKFRTFASALLPQKQIEDIIQTVWHLDSLGDIRDLTRLPVKN